MFFFQEIYLSHPTVQQSVLLFTKLIQNQLKAIQRISWLALFHYLFNVFLMLIVLKFRFLGQKEANIEAYFFLRDLIFCANQIFLFFQRKNHFYMLVSILLFLNNLYGTYCYFLKKKDWVIFLNNWLQGWPWSYT